MLELGPADLALSPREARLLLEAAGVDISPDDVLELTHKTEGWAAGLYLASLSFKDRSGNGSSPGSFGGDDRFVADYLRQEHLSRLTPKERRFVTRSAVLRQMSAPLCDAVLERRDSARTLQALERANLFLVPLDHRREWFRYNRVFREMLLAELQRDEPELVSELNRRAADWWEANGAVDGAIDYAEAAGDSTRMARLVTAVSVPGKSAARIGRLEDWFDQRTSRSLADNPALSVLEAGITPCPAARSTRPLGRCGGACDARRPLPDGCTSTEPWLRVLAPHAASRSRRCAWTPRRLWPSFRLPAPGVRPHCSSWELPDCLRERRRGGLDLLRCVRPPFASADACTGMAARRAIAACGRSQRP